MNRLPSGFCLAVAALVALLSAMVPAKAQTLLDFRTSHTVQQAVAAGITTRDFKQGENEVLHVMGPENLVIALPGGQQVHWKTSFGTFVSGADGSLRNLEVFGPVLPADEAYAVALKAHQAFGIPTDRLENWKQETASKGRFAMAFSNGQNAFYPHVFIEMQHSMNALYPWHLRVELSWNGLPQDKHDEAWGAAHNPRPPPGFENVSFDAPSGRTYDRADAYQFFRIAADVAVGGFVVGMAAVLWYVIKARRRTGCG